MELTLYQQHKKEWKKGCGSDECDKAHKKVLCRGTVPCDVLLIGEGPGESENVIGKPFVGPAGHLLDYIIERSIGEYNQHCSADSNDGSGGVSWAMTNIVACIPRDEEGHKTVQPSEEQVQACRPRLEEFIEICQPRLIVAVGKEAHVALEQGYMHSVKLPKIDGKKPTIVQIYHPSYILRSGIAGQSLLIDEAVVIIEDAVIKVFSPKPERKKLIKTKYKEAEKKWKMKKRN